MNYPALMYFNLHDETHDFFWLDAHSQWIHVQHSEPPEDFLRVAHERDVKVFLPAESVLLRQVVMPSLGLNELKQAVPFALEEELIDDLGDLHFALALSKNELAVSVAVIARQHMQKCLTYFKKHRLPVVLLTSELFLLPIETNSCSLLLTEKHYLLRAGSWLGFAGDINELPSFFSLAQQQIGSSMHYDVYSYNNAPPSLPYAVHTMRDVSSSLHWLIDRFVSIHLDATVDSVNLLQGDFNYRVTSTSQKNRWRNGALACIGLSVLIFLFYPLIPAYIVSMQVADLKIQTEKAYRIIFPEAKTVIAPKLRIEERLAEYSASSNKASFLMLLVKLADAKSTTSGIRFLKLEYQDNRVQLALVADGTNQLNKFVAQLQTVGLNVKEQNTAVEGMKVKTTLELTSA